MASGKPAFKKSGILACLTSGLTRLIVLSFTAYVLTLVSVTWYGVTAYHVTARDVQDDEGMWGDIYDASRDFTKKSMSAMKASSDFLHGKKVHSKLPDDFFNIESKHTKIPKGWQASLLTSFMVIITIVNSVMAILTWLVVAKNSLVTCCGEAKFDVDPEARESRLNRATDIMLGWQVAIPLIAKVITYFIGLEHCGVPKLLYHKMTALGPLAVIALKLLNILMSTLKNAEASLNRSGDTAWTLASKNHASKTQATKQCAIDIFENAHVISSGPEIIQKVLRGLMLAGVFVERPCGVALGIMGLIDKKIMSKLTVSLLGVIPSWIEKDIDAIEAKMNAAESEAEQIGAELDAHLLKIKKVFVDAAEMLDGTTVHLEEARGMMSKHKHTFGDTFGALLVKLVNDVEAPLKAIATDVEAATIEIIKLLETGGNKAMAEMKEIVKSLTKMLESIRPVNILMKLENLADEALYGDVIKAMATFKQQGASHLGVPAGAGHSREPLLAAGATGGGG